MTGFRYRAHNAKGGSFSGIVHASSREEAERILARQNLLPDEIRAESGNFLLNLRRTPDSRAMVQFARQFATLIQAGLPLITSLGILEGLTTDVPLRRALALVTSDIQDGRSLTEALRKHPRVFSTLFTSMIEAGEKGGSIDVSLQRSADHMERAQVIRDRVRAAMVYPSFIGLAAVGAVIALLVLVVPTFESMFSASQMELPFPTLVLVGASRFLGEQWLLTATVGVALVMGARAFYRSTPGKRLVDRAVLRIPLLQSLVTKVYVARVTRTLGSLLASGIPVVEALSVASRTASNVMVEEALLRARSGVTGGSTVSGSLQRESLFPPMMFQMVSIGEQTGQLAPMFSKVADFYEQEVETAVDGFLKALEPIMVVVVGLVMGGMVVAMYLPIFDAVGTVG